MKLKEFITNTIVEMVEGIAEAQKQVMDSGALINPRGLPTHEATVLMTPHGEHVGEIEFDIAVTAEEGSGTKGGIGVFMGAVNLGSSGQSEAKNTSVSRLKFKVAVLFPPGCCWDDVAVMNTRNQCEREIK